MVAVVAGFAAFHFLAGGTSRTDLSLTQFRDRLTHGQVRQATLLDKDHVIQGTLTNGTAYSARFPAGYTDTVTKEIIAAHVGGFRVDGQQSSAWVGILLTILPFVLILGVVFFLLRQVQGGGRGITSFGRARAKPLSKDQPTVTFADVAGLDEAVAELREIEEFLEDPARFRAMGAKIPKGVLLYGPPGTGKTLLARAVAGAAGVPFFSISGSDFVEMFVGVGASRVRDLFEQAKAAAPAIVFVDEIDAVGRHRGAGVGGGHDEREQTLNQLLVEMDGFDQRSGVILLASTNRPDILDPALLRPGRFDRQIVVDRPDLEGRKAILAVHATEKPLAPGVDLALIARRTPGFTGADLANLLNEAALLSARHGLKLIGLPQLEEAIDRVMAGPERRSRVISDRERRIIAYHEGGHALVAHALPNTDPVHKISIIPRGRALGYTLTLPTEDKFLVTRDELVDELAMLLGGRTAEELIFADPTTGAQNDIDRATTDRPPDGHRVRHERCARPDAVRSAPQGEVFLGRDFTSTPDYSDDVAARIDAEVARLVEHAHAVAREIIQTNRAVLDRLAAELIEHETLEAERVQELFADVTMWASAPEDAPDSSRSRTRGPDGAPPVANRNPAAAASHTDSSPLGQPHRGRTNRGGQG